MKNLCDIDFIELHCVPVSELNAFGSHAVAEV